MTVQRGVRRRAVPTLLLEAETDEPLLGTSSQGRRLRWADLVDTLIVEATIHYLDLTLNLPAPPAPASALLHVRKVLDGLLGTELQLEWDDVEYALKGTGRVALTAADRDHLGDLALKIPLLG